MNRFINTLMVGFALVLTQVATAITLKDMVKCEEFPDPPSGLIQSIREWDTLPPHQRINAAFYHDAKHHVIKRSFDVVRNPNGLPSDYKSIFLEAAKRIQEDLPEVYSTYYPLIGEPFLSEIEVATTPTGELLAYQ